MDNNEEIRKGFNAGYMLEKLNPKLAQKLREGMTDKNSPFMLGFAKGSEEYSQESFFDSTQNVPSDVQDLDLDNLPDNDLGKGKDNGLEP